MSLSAALQQEAKKQSEKSTGQSQITGLSAGLKEEKKQLEKHSVQVGVHDSGQSLSAALLQVQKQQVQRQGDVEVAADKKEKNDGAEFRFAPPRSETHMSFSDAVMCLGVVSPTSSDLERKEEVSSSTSVSQGGENSLSQALHASKTSTAVDIVPQDNTATITQKAVDNAAQTKAALIIQKAFRLKQQRETALRNAWNELDMREEGEVLIARRSDITQDILDKVKKEMQTKDQPPSFKRQPSVAEAISRLGLMEEGTIVGPRLPDVIHLSYVIAMLNRFRDDHRMPAIDLMRLLLRILPILKALPNIVLFDPPCNKITIVGDIHGQLDDLFTIFKMNGLPSNENAYLFNGDFVDRGSHGVECAVVIFLFKLLYPEYVHVNRGNHEALDVNEWGGFESEVNLKYGMEAFNMFQEVFTVLPLACIIRNKIYVVHAGLPANFTMTLGQMNDLDRFHQIMPDDTPQEQMLWSDPREINGITPNKRGAGVEFGADATNTFLSLWGLQMMVRSHEVKPQGYDVQHGDRVITIFSASHYCGVMKNAATFMIFTKNDDQPEIVQFVATSKDESKPFQAGRLVKDNNITRSKSNVREELVRKLAPRIVEHKPDLNAHWSKFDKYHTGEVSRIQFAAGLCEILEIDLPYLLLLDTLHVSTKKNKQGHSVVSYRNFLNEFKSVLRSRGSSRASSRASRRSRASVSRENDANLDSDEEDTKEFAATGAEQNVILPRTLHKTDSIEHTIEVISSFVFKHRHSLRRLFKFLDIDRSGDISYSEFIDGIKALRPYFPERLSDRDIMRLCQYVDFNNDGVIEYWEFFDAFKIEFPGESFDDDEEDEEDSNNEEEEYTSSHVDWKPESD